MAKNADLESKRLPSEEWDFIPVFDISEIKDDSNAFITAVFFYEYFRSSSTWLRILKRFSKSSDIVYEVENKIGNWRKQDVEDASHDSIVICNHSFFDIIQAIYNTWGVTQKLPAFVENTRFANEFVLTAEIQKNDAVKIYNEHVLKPFEKIITAESEDEAASLINGHALYQYYSRREREEFEGLAILGIDWRFKNEEIMESFTRYLEHNRPHDLADIQPIKKRGLQQVPLELDCSKRHALDCLGVWRRKQLCSWSEYIKLYHPSRDPKDQSLKRALIRNCREAEEILDWFESRGVTLLEKLSVTVTKD